MQEIINRNIENVPAAHESRINSPFLQLADSRSRQRRLRIAIPVRRREACMTKRAMLAALREAEFADWLESGGDFLDAMHQPVH